MTPRTLVASALGLLVASIWSPAALGQCPGWSLLEITRSVQALETFDDGTGSALYAGGGFSSAGGAPASFVARWDGASWAPLGSGTNQGVRALMAHDDGSGPALYAGGQFTTAGGVPAVGVARWDGTSWAAVGTGLSASVRCFEAYDDGSGPALYAGRSSGVDKWDGTSWSQVASSNNYVYGLGVYDDGSGPALYAGGQFTFLGGTPKAHLAKWDGASWSDVGGGANGVVYSFGVWDDGNGAALYVGGDFTSVGGAAASRVARWDGATWSALGSGTSSRVTALQAFDYGAGLHLYAGGRFTVAGGNASQRIARWDGSAWSPLIPSIPAFEVFALERYDDGGGTALYAGLDGTGFQPQENLGQWGAAPVTSYCTSGTSAGGCKAQLAAAGTPSASAASGFTVSATRVEGVRNGRFYFGTAGRQAKPWGNGTSYRCVQPPTRRTPVVFVGGTLGNCDGGASLDLNAHWTANSAKNPGAGLTVNLQFWYRDSQSTSNAPTSFSDALEFGVCP